MKRILIAAAITLAAGGQVLAADLPQAPLPPATYVPVPVGLYNWTGFYIGGNLGVGWNQAASYSDSFGNTISFNNTWNFLGGGQVGFNYQFGSVVIGAEADFDWLPNSSNTAAPSAGGYSVTDNNGWLTTVTGRVGYAFDRGLVYGKGGGAWVGSSNSTINNGAGVTFSTSTSSNYGWTAGLGGEWAFWGNWSVRLEYDYVGLNSLTFTVPAGAPFLVGDTFTGSNRNIQMVNFGINYKFGY